VCNIYLLDSNRFLIIYSEMKMNNLFYYQDFVMLCNSVYDDVMHVI
jgi:hypothetical protein